MAAPYALYSCVHIGEILNRRAQGEQELLDGIEEADPTSIYYHMHSYYLHGRYEHDPYPNDFASWVANHVRDRVLSERLAVIDPFNHAGVESLRRELILVVESHLDTLGFSPRALFGEPFDFMRCEVIPVPTGIEVRTAPELREALRLIPPEALFYHFFHDAFGRSRKTGGLVDWVANELEEPALARTLSEISPYRLHLEHLRSDVLRVFEKVTEN